MKFVSKTILACAVAAASMFAATAAQAVVYNPFTVDPTGPSANFTADKITGNYTEIATFNPDGTFSVSLMWDAGQFVTNNGNTAIKAGVTGLGVNYGIYALYTASGTVSTSGSVTSFTFAPGTGSFKFVLDANNNTTATAPTTGSGAFALANASDDIVLANGAAISGLGQLNSALPTCGDLNGLNCGSFGSTTSFNLTADGKNFFIAPNPFYGLSFQSGQLNNFSFSGTQVINGSLDVAFRDVPEPASLGLLGLGLLGLGFVRGRKQS